MYDKNCLQFPDLPLYFSIKFSFYKKCPNIFFFENSDILTSLQSNLLSLDKKSLCGKDAFFKGPHLQTE